MIWFKEKVSSVSTWTAEGQSDISGTHLEILMGLIPSSQGCCTSGLALMKLL